MGYLIISEPRVLPAHTSYALVKRAMDVGLCLVLAPLAILIGLVCALAIYVESGGPVLFLQERVGRGGRLFRMWKFRTMWDGLDDAPHRAFMRAFVRGQNLVSPQGRPVYKPFQGTEVTRVGRLLRKASLDELPQLINVLRGEMSLVGPRPNVPDEVAEYRLWHHERLEVLPGITGLAQVRGRSGLAFNAIVSHDLDYVTHASLWLDLKILYWTFQSVIMRDGAL